MSKLEEVVKSLPPDLQHEVEDFVQFLIQKRTRRGGGKLQQAWAGALRNYREQYTSLELQRKAFEWRGD